MICPYIPIATKEQQQQKGDNKQNTTNNESIKQPMLDLNR